MSEASSERRMEVKEKMIEVLSHHKGGVPSSQIADETRRLYRLGRLGFEQEVDEYLRELEKEGRVERVKKTRPDDFVWHGEKGSRHPFVVWRLAKKERTRLLPKND